MTFIHRSLDDKKEGAGVFDRVKLSRGVMPLEITESKLI
jgi:hypothetical protein